MIEGHVFLEDDDDMFDRRHRHRVARKARHSQPDRNDRRRSTRRQPLEPRKVMVGHGESLSWYREFAPVDGAHHSQRALH
jgi:hypothetical protein